ncbi:MULTISPECIES: type II secretion system protein [Shewanella]|uniref:MSHA pilin protein MshA n=1 Tax=Shewanella glacialipiscicola TaxID=614069 RepID=A0ABQ6J5T4_9GAMM|nr:MULTISPECIES: type II secretion system protein [Shewanella]GIU07665.1 MSHA pilin protein MshA [Shewanella glacialipiscicola]GMA83503.1 MSHA pilin protein MshA [Shewanella glacialipiscicola]SIR01929.1 MSHA pilin protein MshA [Shewanella morhuae]
MKRQQGFTLIELVVVIIILGILAVTAAPKFINLQGDARASAIQGMKGAIQGANSLVYSKAALKGEEKKAFNDTVAPSVDIGTGTPAVTHYGYLQSTAAELKNAMDLNISNTTTDKVDWFIVEGADGSAMATIYQAGSPYATDSTKECYVTYTPATSTETPKYEVKSEDC